MVRECGSSTQAQGSSMPEKCEIESREERRLLACSFQCPVATRVLGSYAAVAICERRVNLGLSVSIPARAAISYFEFASISIALRVRLTIATHHEEGLSKIASINFKRILSFFVLELAGASR
jgi:hypothetical protein